MAISSHILEVENDHLGDKLLIFQRIHSCFHDFQVCFRNGGWMRKENIIWMKRSTCEERWSGNILTQTFSLQVLEMNSDPLMSAQRLADRHTEVSTNPRHRIPNGQKGRAGLVSRRGCLVCWFLSVTCFFFLRRSREMQFKNRDPCDNKPTLKATYIWIYPCPDLPPSPKAQQLPSLSTFRARARVKCLLVGAQDQECRWKGGRKHEIHHLFLLEKTWNKFYQYHQRWR